MSQAAETITDMIVIAWAVGFMMGIVVYAILEHGFVMP